MEFMKFKFFVAFSLLSLVLCMLACSDNDKPLDETTDNEEQNMQQKVVDAVIGFKAVATPIANELQLNWENPSGAVLVEISYAYLEGEEVTSLVTTNRRVYGEKNSKYVIQLPKNGTYQISAVAIDNYGRRSETVTILATPAKENAEIPDVVLETKLPIADPYVLYFDGKYYAYGTRVNGFEVYISDDLKRWRRNKALALSPDNSWGTKWYWAPEVYYVQSKKLFYMFYSVEEHICVATSTSPEGPFIQKEKKPIVSDEKGIDTSLFIDEDGTPYLYYVRFTGGNVIWVAEMNEDMTSIKKETLKQCVSVSESWEKKQGTIAEGPSLLKRGDTYYLIYSANHYESKDYAVGYATASSPKGPWKKYSGNPILRRDKEAAQSLGLVGTGHGAPFVCAGGNFKYIFHAHASETSVGPRTSYISNFKFSDDGVISISGETIEPVIIK